MNRTCCAVVRVHETNKFTISGGNDERVTPVPIPNTEVKPLSADGTWLDTARESRSSPDPISLEEFLRGVFFIEMIVNLMLMWYHIAIRSDCL